MTVYKSTSQQLKLFEQQSSLDSQTWQPVRDDFNFCRLPYFVASRRREDRFRNLQMKYEVEINGRTFEAVWEVQHSSSLGLPGSYERDVWIGIMEIVQELTDGGKKAVPKVIDLGPTNRFLNRIGKKHGGKQVAAFKDALRRLTKTTCFTEKAFKCPASGGYLSSLEPINLICKCGFKGEPDDKGGVHESTWVELSEFIRSNLQTGYITLIDTQYVRSLKNEAAKLLYTLLSYRLWLAAQRGRDFWSAHWRELETYLGVSGWCALWRAKDELKEAIAELKSNQYIDQSSDWEGESFVFKVGEKFIDELRSRINAREQFDIWVKGKLQVRQLSLLPSVLPQYSTQQQLSTSEDARDVVLTRQAIKVAFLNQQPDEQLLQTHGWTVDDARSLAATLQKQQPQ